MVGLIGNLAKGALTKPKQQKVTPKQGRVVIFDGGQYHTAQQCKDKIRCIANYNIA